MADRGESGRLSGRDEAGPVTGWRDGGGPGRGKPGGEWRAGVRRAGSRAGGGPSAGKRDTGEGDDGDSNPFSIAAVRRRW